MDRIRKYMGRTTDKEKTLAKLRKMHGFRDNPEDTVKQYNDVLKTEDTQDRGKVIQAFEKYFRSKRRKQKREVRQGFLDCCEPAIRACRRLAPFFNGYQRCKEDLRKPGLSLDQLQAMDSCVKRLLENCLTLPDQQFPESLTTFLDEKLNGMKTRKDQMEELNREKPFGPDSRAILKSMDDLHKELEGFANELRNNGITTLDQLREHLTGLQSEIEECNIMKSFIDHYKPAEELHDLLKPVLDGYQRWERDLKEPDIPLDQLLQMHSDIQTFLDQVNKSLFEKGASAVPDEPTKSEKSKGKQKVSETSPFQTGSKNLTSDQPILEAAEGGIPTFLATHLAGMDMAKGEMERLLKTFGPNAQTILGRRQDALARMVKWQQKIEQFSRRLEQSNITTLDQLQEHLTGLQSEIEELPFFKYGSEFVQIVVNFLYDCRSAIGFCDFLKPVLKFRKDLEEPDISLDQLQLMHSDIQTFRDAVGYMSGPPLQESLAIDLAGMNTAKAKMEKWISVLPGEFDREMEAGFGGPTRVGTFEGPTRVGTQEADPGEPIQQAGLERPARVGTQEANLGERTQEADFGGSTRVGTGLEGPKLSDTASTKLPTTASEFLCSDNGSGASSGFTSISKEPGLLSNPQNLPDAQTILDQRQDALASMTKLLRRVEKFSCKLEESNIKTVGDLRKRSTDLQSEIEERITFLENHSEFVQIIQHYRSARAFLDFFKGYQCCREDLKKPDVSGPQLQQMDFYIQAFLNRVPSLTSDQRFPEDAKENIREHLLAGMNREIGKLEELPKKPLSETIFENCQRVLAKMTKLKKEQEEFFDKLGQFNTLTLDQLKNNLIALLRDIRDNKAYYLDVSDTRVETVGTRTALYRVPVISVFELPPDGYKVQKELIDKYNKIRVYHEKAYHAVICKKIMSSISQETFEAYKAECQHKGSSPIPIGDLERYTATWMCLKVSLPE